MSPFRIDLPRTLHLPGAAPRWFTWAAVGSAACLFAPPASACGGLFCSAANPVEQTAERIVFSQNDDDTITAIIEVQYQGPSERFGWLLPMPGTPKVNVSTKGALDAIDAATLPRYELERTWVGDCKPETREATGAGAVFAPPRVNVSDDAGGITVLDQGNAGPYDYVTIDPDDDLDNPAEAAIDWLEENGYDVGVAAAVLEPYLAQGLNLVAFRLTKGQDAGAIRPVQLTYAGTTPSIPIIPTSVAAADDMGIRVFLLGKQRAASDNYLSLKLNEARINWFNWQDGYDALVSEAADEAGAFGFVTEYAGTTKDLKAQIWSPSLDEAWNDLESYEGTAAQTMMYAANWFRGFDGFQRAVEQSVDLPEGLTVQDFGSDPVGYEEQYGEDIADKAAFLAALEAEIVDPLREAQALVDEFPQLSRLYTTLSPEEMVLDPTFFYSSDLDEVSNVHRAQMTIFCNPDVYSWEAPYKITLESGAEIYGEPADGTTVRSGVALPAAAVIQTAGGEDLEDNTVAIRETLEDAAPSPPPEARSEGGCSVGLPGKGETPTWALSLLALATAVTWRSRGRSLWRRTRSARV